MNVAYNASQPLRQYSFQNTRLSQIENLIVSLLKSCKSTCHSSQLHAAMIKNGLDRDRFLTSKLLSSVIHDTHYAASIFSSSPNRNIFMYNAMLRSYSISDVPGRAIDVFYDLRCRGLELDEFTFVSVNKAIAREALSKTGQMVHCLALRSGFLSHVNIKNSVLHVYGVCGRMLDGRKLFDEIPERNDLVSWNIMMGSYLKVSQPDLCIALFQEVLRGGLQVSVTTIICILSAFSILRISSHGGQSVHGFCIKAGLLSNSNLRVATALIKFYSLMSRIEEARFIFDTVEGKDIILWNCMIDSYAQIGLFEEALALVEQMKREKMQPNSSTVVGLLSGLGASGLCKFGSVVNDIVVGHGLELDAVLGTALVDMYAKCGDLSKAVDIFNRMKSKDLKSWTALIGGYGLHGQARSAISLCNQMEREGLVPNDVTFLAVLSACSHCGLVDEAIVCFRKMVQVYGLTPNMDHYASIIDLLGRAGMLDEGYGLISSLPINTDVVAWRALLSACRVYGNVDLAKCVRSKLLEMVEEHPADSILFSSSCAMAGESTNVAKDDDLKSMAGATTEGTTQGGTHWIKAFLK